jgi:hypothetical protein
MTNNGANNIAYPMTNNGANNGANMALIISRLYGAISTNNGAIIDDNTAL